MHSRDEYDRNSLLKELDDTLQSDPFRKAYLHIASCTGCRLCKPHKDDVSAVQGFNEQQWRLFQSLLLKSGVSWEEYSFTRPPNESRIGKLRSMLEDWKKGKGEGKAK